MYIILLYCYVQQPFEIIVKNKRLNVEYRSYKNILIFDKYFFMFDLFFLNQFLVPPKRSVLNPQDCYYKKY
jgi:hypothetical protein